MNGLSFARKRNNPIDSAFFREFLHIGGIIMETKHYAVEKIEGEYATLKDVNTGDELFIAMALLPDETDIGVRLKWEDLTYSVEE